MIRRHETFDPTGAAGDDTVELNQVLAEYLQAVEAGRPVDRDRLLAEHPRFAAELADFFADEQRLARAVPAARVPRGRPAVSESGLLDDSTESPAGGPTDGGEGGPEFLLAGPAAPRTFADYELLEEIGRGGMGAVFRARHVRLNRLVALKMILAGQFATAEEVRRFQIEARNAAQLDHPNIVPIYEVGTFRGRHYFTMKLVEGGSLADRIGQFTSDHRAAARLMAVTARAVHYAHQRGVLHRDLKPANVLLDADSQPQVTDFGLAKRLSSDGSVASAEMTGITLAGAVLGTPRYMAPEQARGERSLTVAADVYGVGAILYELLTGRPPFHADTVFEMLRQVREQEPPRPSLVAARVDRDLETICLKCLEKDSQRRYASAEAVAEDLEYWLAGEPILARPVTNWQRAIKWARRKPALAGLSATAAVAALLIVALAVALPYQVRLRRSFHGIEQALGSARQAQRDADDARRKETEQRRIAQEAFIRAEAAREGERRQRTIAESAAAGARSYGYMASIAWAEREWASNDVRVAEAILDDCPADLRAWEWRYLKQLCHAERLEVRAAGGIRAVATAADSDLAVTLDESGRVSAWNGRTGHPVDVPHFGRPSAIAISPDGRRLAAADSGYVRVSDLNADGAWGEARMLAFPISERSTATIPSEFRSALAFSADGRWLAGACPEDPTVHVWDASTGGARAALVGHTECVNGLAFSPDGNQIVSCSGEPAVQKPNGVTLPAKPGEIRIWDLGNGTAINGVGFRTGVIAGVSFLSPARFASAHSDGTVKIWDARTGRLEDTLRGHADAVLAVTASPDGKRIASAGADQTVRLWDSNTGEPVSVYRGHTGPVRSVAYLPGADGLISGADDKVMKVWDATTGPEARVLEVWGHDVAFSPDSGLLAAGSAGDDAVHVWDVKAGRELYQTKVGGASSGCRLSFSPDGTCLAATSASGLKLIDTATGRIARTLDASCTAVSFSPDGQRVATAEADRESALIYDVRTGVVLHTLKRPRGRSVFDVAFSPDGKLLATAGGTIATGGPAKALAGTPGDVTIWDAQTGKVVRELVGQQFCCWSVTFSPDGKKVACGGGLYGGSGPNRAYEGPGGEVRVWDVETGREVFAADRRDCIFRLAFSPDGTRLVSGGGRGRRPSANELVLTDVAGGRDLMHLKGHRAEIDGLAFSPDGRLLASASADKTVRIWNTAPITAGVWKPPASQPIGQPTSPTTRPVITLAPG